MRLVLVDDDAFVVESLVTILGAQPDIDVVGTAGSGPQAERMYEKTRPDVLLMDIRMPEGDGLTAAEHIISKHGNARIVFLTTFADDDYIVRALRLGACGYLIKQDVAAIAPALRSVMAGQNVLGGDVMGRAFNVSRETFFAHPALTEREQRIVELVAQGLDNREIARAIYISEGTVRNHISSILAKLNLKNRTQIAIVYWRGTLH